MHLPRRTALASLILLFAAPVLAKQALDELIG
jgi:hypothetical protein